MNNHSELVREKLVDKLVKLGVFVTRDHAYCVADWIIARDKKNAEEFIKRIDLVADDIRTEIDRRKGYPNLGKIGCLKKIMLLKNETLKNLGAE